MNVAMKTASISEPSLGIINSNGDFSQRNTKYGARYGVLLAQGLMLLLMACIGMAGFLEATWFHWSGVSVPYPPNWAGYTWYQFTGYFIFIGFGILGIGFLIILSQQMAVEGPEVPFMVRTLYLLGMVLLSAAGGVFSGYWSKSLLTCGLIGCTNPENSLQPTWGKPGIVEGFLAYNGLAMLCVSVASYCLHTALLLRLLCYQPFLRKPRLDVEAADTDMILANDEFRQRTHVRRRVNKTCLIVVPLAILWYVGWGVLATFMPNSWEYFTPGQMAVQRTLWIPDVQNPTNCNNWPATCPEFENAVWKSKSIEYLPQRFYFKIFPDLIVYHAGLPTIALLLSLAALFGIGKGFFSSVLSVRIPSVRRVAITAGAAACWFLILCTFALWTWYWYWNHNWDGFFPSSNNVSVAENLARTSGMVAILFEALLLLPASRNSVLPHILGVSWESTIYAHRLLGYGMLISLIIHAVAWGFVYHALGNFPHDMFAMPSWRSAQVDNFTVPFAMYATVIAMITIGIFSFYKIRRRFFELFFFMHHIGFLMLIPASLVHAASGYFFLVPPLTLWFIDRCMRFWYSCRTIRVNFLRVRGETTEIVISRSERGAESFANLQPGQFVFMNVPDLSLFEWHPFTVSSSPTEANLTIHVKRMGSREWSGKLHRLARAWESSAGDSLPPRICLDGPYGVPIDYRRYQSIVLFAGGIGITPVHSIFRFLYDIAHTSPAEVPDRVMLVWTVQLRQELQLFAPTISQAIRDNLGRKFLVSLHATREKAAAAAVANYGSGGGFGASMDLSASMPPQMTELAYTPERPDIHRILNESRPPNGPGLVFVCGPSSMVETCQLEASRLGFECHAETFEL